MNSNKTKMRVTAVIIDDEKNNIENLTVLLRQHCAEVKVLASAMNADEGEEAILLHNPDLIFLDIQMPGKNGFDMLKSIANYSFELIFVTAFDQYGIQAVKFAAIDYLLKPINTTELKEAVEKVVQKSSHKKQNDQLENLMQLLRQKNDKEKHRIALNTLKETRFIHPHDIIHCDAANNYTTFYLRNGEKLVVSRPIYEYEEILAGYDFIRCHQSHLVNKNCVKSWIKKDGDFLQLENGTEIPVSRNKKDIVKEALLHPGNA